MAEKKTPNGSSKPTDSKPADDGLVGAINPYALSELVTGRTIRWAEVDSPRVLEEVLATPYEQLFDPKYDSPR